MKTPSKTSSINFVIGIAALGIGVYVGRKMANHLSQDDAQSIVDSYNAILDLNLPSAQRDILVNDEIDRLINAGFRLLPVDNSNHIMLG